MEYKLLEKTYNELLQKIIQLVGDGFYDLLIQYESVDGTTIVFSWKDRDKRLEERDGS